MGVVQNVVVGRFLWSEWAFTSLIDMDVCGLFDAVHTVNAKLHSAITTLQNVLET